MGKNVVQKILEEHLVSGKMTTGTEIELKINQTLTQDATGTMAYMQFEAMEIPRVKTELSMSYVDHNTLQTGFENADDHLYLQSVASKYGIQFSRAGNGICHQVHLERFGEPGKTLLGSDSHTPTAGGLGMLAFGAGGLDIAVAMAGAPYIIEMPKIVGVKLVGELQPWVSAKDLILEMLRRLTVKGGVGKIFEYFGDGIKSLTVPERATITNMGTELGATTSIFPNDQITLEFLKSQERDDVWREIVADYDAEYDEIIEIDLGKIEPLIAQPHSPDNVCRITENTGTKVDQVAIGSCTNSSYKDLMTVAKILEGKRVHRNVSLVICPGSRQVLEMLAENGALTELIRAGARILEPACGPCIGMGQAPPSGGISLRTFNRNFKGRSGTQDAQLYLVSPEVAAASALRGFITDPRELGEPVHVEMPEKFIIDDGLIIPPSDTPDSVEIIRGPNIQPPPKGKSLPSSLSGEVLLKVGDNITTDDITPAGAWLKYRSNVPRYSEAAFCNIDPDFHKIAKEKPNGIIVGGANYGQGSSREHAALVPRYLGIKAVMAKSFARIHHANLVNFGIIPLIFVNEYDYELIEKNDLIDFGSIRDSILSKRDFKIKNLTKDIEIEVRHELSDRGIKILLSGGLLNYTVENS